MNTPAGWYPDPADDSCERWWDGTGWTEIVQAKNVPAPSPSRPANIRPADQSDFGQGGLDPTLEPEQTSEQDPTIPDQSGQDFPPADTENEFRPPAVSSLPFKPFVPYQPVEQSNAQPVERPAEPEADDIFDRAIQMGGSSKFHPAQFAPDSPLGAAAPMPPSPPGPPMPTASPNKTEPLPPLLAPTFDPLPRNSIRNPNPADNVRPVTAAGNGRFSNLPRRPLLFGLIGLVVIVVAFVVVHHGKSSTPANPASTLASTPKTPKTPVTPKTATSPAHGAAQATPVNIVTCKQATPSTNRLRIRSPKTDRSGHGHNFDFCAPQAKIVVHYLPSSGTLLITSWNGTGRHDLVTTVRLVPTHSPLKNGDYVQHVVAGKPQVLVRVLPAKGPGPVSCRQIIGSFQISQFVREGTNVKTVHAVWSQHCVDSSATLTGDLSYVSRQAPKHVKIPAAATK